MKPLIFPVCHDYTCEKHMVKVWKEDLLEWLTQSINKYWQENPDRREDLWDFRNWVEIYYEK